MNESKPIILLVEDDKFNQLYLNAVLKQNYELISSYTAEQALKYLDEKSIDLILMDISLKGVMNGIELTRKLRQMPVYKDIPVIAMTGYVTTEDRQMCFDAGCNSFLAKPFNEYQLIQNIKKYV